MGILFSKPSLLQTVANRGLLVRYKKVKRTLVQALRLCTGLTANSGSRGIALLFYYHGTRREWGVSVTPQPPLTPGKNRYPLYRRLGGSQGRSGHVRKISLPQGFDPRTVQLVASRYTDYATRPTRATCNNRNLNENLIILVVLITNFKIKQYTNSIFMIEQTMLYSQKYQKIFLSTKSNSQYFS